MAASIKEQLNHQTVLIAGSGGEFELVADGQLVYSKRSTGRFPDTEEILSKLNSLR